MGEHNTSISMIAAVSRDGVIGVDGQMPWYIPSDFAHFKRVTMGKPLIMGRKQFETVGKPLPGRVNIVVSRQPGYQPEGVIVINEFDAAIAHAGEIAAADNVDEIMIIGGGEIYSLGMKKAERLYISHVDLDIGQAGSASLIKFPDIDPKQWEIEQELPVIPIERDSATYSIKVYGRRRPQTH